MENKSYLFDINENIKRSKDKYDLKTEHLVAKKVIIANNCENIDTALLDEPRQSIIFFGKDKSLKIKENGYIVLDFGSEIQGGINICINDVLPGTKLRISFGESVSEAMSDIGYKNSTNEHSIRDVVLPVTCWQTFRYGNTGFRFVMLEAVEGDVYISGVQAVFEYRDIEYKGEFSCDNELLNRIWKTGAYTVHLNMQEYLFDGIKRDRVVWLGDMHPELSTILSVFGDNDVISKSLDVIRDYTPESEWINTLPSYHLWWFINQLDYYMWSGDFTYLKKQEKFVCNACEKILSEINDDGTHNIGKTAFSGEDCDGKNNANSKFSEWSSYQTVNEDAAFQAIMILGLNAASKICTFLGLDELGTKCDRAATLMKGHIYPYKENKQVAAMVSLAGMVDGKKVSDEILKIGGARGFATFWGYYTLQALAKSGDMKDALSSICDFWGKMLEMGATTFWESFNIEWAENATRIDEIAVDGKKDIHGDFGEFCYQGFRHSLCHGWASGPTAFLSQKVLGIEIVEPGCKKIRINPDLGCLQWAKGTYPTPLGSISVEHTVENGHIVSNISVPEGIEVV